MSSAALFADPQEVPLLRARLKSLEEKFGFNPKGHTGKAMAHALSEVARYRPDAVVLSLGADAYKHDPVDGFLLESHDFTAMGRMIAAIDRPLLFVM